MKKSLITIVVFAITLCLLTGCTENKILINSEDNSKTLEISLPKEYYSKNLNNTILIYTTEDQATDNWDMMLTFEKTNYKEYKSLISKNKSISKTKDFKNNISYYLLENKELNQGSHFAMRKMNDEYIVILRAQLKISQNDMVGILNSAKLKK